MAVAASAGAYTDATLTIVYAPSHFSRPAAAGDALANDLPYLKRKWCAETVR